MRAGRGALLKWPSWSTVSLTYGLFTQVSDSGPQGPLVLWCMHLSIFFWSITSMLIDGFEKNWHSCSP